MIDLVLIEDDNDVEITEEWWEMKYNKMDFSKKDQLLPNGICKAYISHVWGYGIRNTSDRYESIN